MDIDLARVVGQAKRLIGPEPGLRLWDADMDELANELLPKWDEEWPREEREQLRVHALEALCSRLGNGGRGAEAVCAGQVTVSAEPLRESAQLVLIHAHIWPKATFPGARRQFDMYRRLLWQDLQIKPSPRITRLLTLPNV